MEFSKTLPNNNNSNPLFIPSPVLNTSTPHISISVLKLYKNPMRQVLLLSLFYRRRNWDREVTELAKAIKIASGISQDLNLTSLSPEPMFSTTVLEQKCVLKLKWSGFEFQLLAFNLSIVQFPHLLDGDKNNHYLNGLLWGLNAKNECKGCIYGK